MVSMHSMKSNGKEGRSLVYAQHNGVRWRDFHRALDDAVDVLVEQFDPLDVGFRDVVGT